MKAKDLSLLVALDALLQEGHVTHAARRLGRSTPAMSHALARIRRQLGDALLVRTGRSMALTPRAEQLRPQVRSLLEAAARVLAAPSPFDPRQLQRTFTVFATDQILLVLGGTVDRLVREEAPDVTLRYLPSHADEWMAVRDGTADLAVCLPGHYPAEFRTRTLLTERFVCVVGHAHPVVRQRLTLDQYLALDHLVVAPVGKPSVVDQVLAGRGLTRRIRRVVPYFAVALLTVARTDYVLTVSESAARSVAGFLGLRLLEPPLPLASYQVNLLWHPRLDADPASQWLRDVFVRAARDLTPAAGRTRRPPDTANRRRAR